MFKNRKQAGKELASVIKRKINPKEFIVVPVLRGGIVPGKEIARDLGVEMYPLIIKKIGAPNQKELAIGAVGPKNTVFWDNDLIKKLGVPKDYEDSVFVEKNLELVSLEKEVSKKKTSVDFKNKKVIVVDDGVATGTTVLCARLFLKKEGASQIVLATPVISEETYRIMEKYFDKVIELEKVKEFFAVGQFYKDFPQVSNEEVLEILRSN